ncbi:MAG: TrkH family potassium uptake protein, partial [Rhodobacteraceae bacterium]|nr:TrkH family potassium uptake protein [Paracoccaceae bacterium]
LGALPFAWYIRAALRRQFRSEQIVMMLRSLVVVIGGLTLWLWADSGMAFVDALRLVAFNVVSVVTTTGYATTDYTLWGPPAVAAFFVLTAVGGCTGSTAGGAKAMRWLLMARAIHAAVRKVHAPHAVTTIRYEERAVGDDVLSGVIAFFTLYFATFVAVAFILGFLGLDMATATSGALTAVANVGPGVGPVIGPAGNFAALPDAAKLVLTVAMYLGRLEILTVFVLLTPMFWREV